MSASACKHENTHFLDEPWPTGEDVEVCKDCGMSRAHWEQGESPWTLIEDIERERDLLERAIRGESE